MTAELKTVLDAYLQWCRENRPEPCVIRATDISMAQVNVLCYMFLVNHPPDLEQDAPTTPTKAAEIFMRIVEYIAEETDREIVFGDLLKGVCVPDDIQLLIFRQNIGKTASEFVRACAGLLDSPNWNRDNMGCTEPTFTIPGKHSRDSQ